MVSQTIDSETLARVSEGYDKVASRSHSLHADCYQRQNFLDLERQQIFHKSWQFLCHEEKLARPGSYIAADVEGRSIFACRDKTGELRAFYNVCKHRGHQLLQGSGQTKVITCPYHAWVYGLDGRLSRARRSELIENFDTATICLDAVRIEVFCHLVFVNLDPEAPVLADESESLSDEIMSYAPDLANLTHAHTLTYRIQANWKTVVDNFLECYHCPVAHRDFCTLVE
ncbi:MAG TPA: ring-hydroxylating oxygenase subunit alpha, partial [Gammaproteobacteria bacterium]|nr:ring-hydroxylating oxygenase subunit alpha [Gammaproteobacteria bacterium]